MLEENSRYSRQTRLAEIGDNGQQLITSGRVLVVGVGGLGLPAAAYLAGAGVGHITLVDHDVVELHNLQRQVFYTEQDVGTRKVEAAARHLRQLNSEIEVCALQERVTDNNVAALVAEHDMVLDAADNFLTTYLLSDMCYAAKTFLVSAAMLGNQGHLGVFCKGAPSYRALFPTAPTAAGNCSQHGVLGTAVGTLGVMQAQEAIKLLANPRSALIGKLLTADFWNNRFTTLDFSSAEEPTDALLIPVLTPGELRDNDLLVDVRSASEIRSQPAPVAGAVHLPDYLLATKLAELETPSDGRIIFFCASGIRARTAAEAMLHQDSDVMVGVVGFW